MIFVTVGTQKFQFNRLLQYIDQLIEENLVQEEVFAQTGYSDYQPKNYSYESFLDREIYSKKLLDSKMVITHGGTGVIMGAIKAGKKVIAVPRLSKYGEHVDDHQLQIVNQMIESKMIMGVSHLEDIRDIITDCSSFHVRPYTSNADAIIQYIGNYIAGLKRSKG